MEMIAHLLRVSEAELEAYRKNSALLGQRVADADVDDPLLYNIDKAWDGIVYLLTGNSAGEQNTHPLAQVLLGRQLIDKDQDMGHGPAHYLDPQQVAQLGVELAGIVPESLRARFDPQAMKTIGIYPNAWDYEGTDDYLIEYYETVQEVFATATQQGEAVITFLS